MLALSQLSYGPETAKCSAEIVVVSPVNLSALVVARRCKPEMDCFTPDRQAVRKKEASIKFCAIRGDRVDLAVFVPAMN